MQKAKRNHWVAQSYLRSFAADGGEKIWRFSKDAGEPELKPIEKVAVRFYLYTPKDADGKRDYSFEHKLAALENWFGHPLWQNLCTSMVDLQHSTVRKMVSLLAAVMYLRNPSQFALWKATHRRFVDFYSTLPDCGFASARHSALKPGLISIPCRMLCKDVTGHRFTQGGAGIRQQSSTGSSTSF